MKDSLPNDPNQKQTLVTGSKINILQLPLRRAATCRAFASGSDYRTSNLMCGSSFSGYCTSAGPPGAAPDWVHPAAMATFRNIPALGRSKRQCGNFRNSCLVASIISPFQLFNPQMGNLHLKCFHPQSHSRVRTSPSRSAQSSRNQHNQCCHIPAWLLK